MSFTFEVVTKIRTRVFEYLCDEPYRTADGRKIELSVWKGSCVVCGGRFWVKTPANADPAASTSFDVTTCAEHRGLRGRLRKKS